MKEVVITGFQILQSVGAGGRNDPGDIGTIQILLNGIPSQQGGAFPPLEAVDDSDNIDRAELQRMVEAIRTFQQLHLHFDDGRVDPEQRTIRKLREIFRKKPIPLPSDVVAFETLVQLNGFDGVGDPPWQMLPVRFPKVLRVEHLAESDRFEFDDDIAFVAIRSGEMITLVGRSPGSTTLRIRRDGQDVADLRLDVVAMRTFSVFFHYVRGSAANQGTRHRSGDAAGLLDGVNRAYVAQANVVFTLAGEAEIQEINGKPVRFDQRKFLIADTAPVSDTPQVFTWSDLVAEAGKRTGADCHVFFVNDVEHFPKSPKCTNCIGGTTMIGTGPAIVEDASSSSNRFVLLAHELGHFLGYPEVHDSPSDALMNAQVGKGANFLKIYEADFHKMNHE